MIPQNAHRVLTWQAMAAGLALGLIAWVVILFLLYMVANYSLGSIFLSSLVTCLLASVATALIVNSLHHRQYLGMLVGWIVGFAIGRMLCAACGSKPVGVKA